MRFPIFSIMPCVAFVSGAAVSAEPVEKVRYEVHDGYFVSNKFESHQATSFMFIADQESFDRVFGSAFVMKDKSHRLPSGVFEKKVVVTAIHRGKAMVTYQVESVVLESHTLVVNYASASTADPATEFACPLILSLEKCDFKMIRFVENGKVVKRLEFPNDQGAEPGGGEQGAISEVIVDGKRILTIGGKGIGRGIVKCDPEVMARETILRAKLQGLESLAISNGPVKWVASVLSHSGSATLLSLWQGGKEGLQLTRESPYWTEIARFDRDGKMVAALPPEGGWFELRVPPALLKDAKNLKIEWIDFYR